MSSLRPGSVCDTTPLQRFESQSSSGEEPSSPTAASIIAAAAAAAATATSTSNSHNLNNNNNVKLDLQLPTFVGSSGLGLGPGPGLGTGLVTGPGSIVTGKRPLRGPKKILGRILLDLCMLSCVGLPMLGLSFWGEPFKRGFFCNDSSLKHPYKHSTIRSWMLYLMCGALPVVLIILVEFFRGQDKRLHGPFKSQMARTGSGYHICHLELSYWLLECYRKIGIFIFGLGVEQLTANVAKYAIGRLRPHFFTLCQPVLWDGSNCSHPMNAGRYIEEFTCGAADMNAKGIRDMSLSFPSGHASFSCYAMLYIVLYLQRRMHWPRLRMVRHLLQFLLLLFAWYTCLTRVSDYKHHCSDVLAGAGIGITYAIVVTSTMW
ncbi:putative phosphatidate phosphatase isoform X1 [Drosophila obscura]|uniref:putative phosphatidate phosphatase isoform X1 n=1 Tax=Drosophila obscura TaxID=7282 RepID=UPI001BB2D073|nr:putative phosphatidate phosphatase isoform X1 [Drosophila obscura]